MSAAQAVSIGSRRELFIDDFLIDSLVGGARRMQHAPQPREVVLVHDRAWEGNTSGYHTFFADGGRVRAYYRGSQSNPRIAGGATRHQVTCMAESDDGIHWHKPSLGVIAFDGSRANNIVHDGDARHNFAPFKDTRPDCPPDQRYKALGGGGSGLIAHFSPDGVHWHRAADEPVITDGKFDSQNLAFWDAERAEYRAYYRDFKKHDPDQPGIRDIKTATSPDFLNWTEGQWLEYPGAPVEQLYTNQVLPCPGAPHLLIGFPTRYVPDRGQITEGVLMASRDRVTFQRRGEALIRPGLNQERWGNRCNYIWHGVIETPSDLPGAPNEWSIYSTEGYYEGASNCVRRFTVRPEGFVSVNAPLAGGEVLTRPLTFEGSVLRLNASTAAAGGVRVEIQSSDGQALPGFEADKCQTLWGDGVSLPVVWRDEPDLGALAGQPVRLRFILEDVDLYSFRFGA